MFLHATAVAISQKAVLLAGPPGAGKSDVALRLIDAGATLVADDQTELSVEGGKLFAAPPPTIAGMMEVRHVGLLKMPFLPRAEVALYVELQPMDAALERLPEDDAVEFLGCAVRRIRLHAFAASTPAKIRIILR
jgi:serine kinase of HPr protein (carbohydrate metabolism regulator)